MNYSEMADCLNSMSHGPLAPVATRIARAGQRGYLWALSTPEFKGKGIPRPMLIEFAQTAALVGCEVQRVVEIWRALKAGGKVIGK